MIEPTTRFSDRVDNYVKYRPSYPADLVEILAEKCGILPDAIIADIGCGTGISSKMFLDAGYSIVGVEPNENMRAAAIDGLGGFERFSAVSGTAEATGLNDRSVDMAIAAQAFHWFDAGETRREFTRILREPGRVALIWNERESEAAEFHTDYELIIRKYGTDYQKIRAHRMSVVELNDFFDGRYSYLKLENSQQLDLEGLIGRTMSSSYMPNFDDPASAEVRGEIETLFAKHERNGRIEILYNTNVYFSCNFICQ